MIELKVSVDSEVVFEGLDHDGSVVLGHDCPSMQMTGVGLSGPIGEAQIHAQLQCPHGDWEFPFEVLLGEETAT